MELQFQRTDISCLERAVCQTVNQEQTQQIRLEDALPSAQRVLCAWGQAILRGKQWCDGCVQVNAGVMAWVLYQGEDGTNRCLQTWVPCQMKVDVPADVQEEFVIAAPLLRNIDARIINERKLMVRVDVSVRVCALSGQTFGVYVPEDLPEDVQVLQKTYPVTLCKEAGEKAFEIDEILALPPSCPQLAQVMSYRMGMELVDRKVMADKVVFRGSGILHMVYQGADGQLYSWDFELPFSQYAQLNGQYEQDATSAIVPAITSMELEIDAQGRLLLKAGAVCQYMIYGRVEITVAQDAYSTHRELQMQTQQLELPQILGQQSHTIRCEKSVSTQSDRVVDVMFCLDQPANAGRESPGTLELSGRFHVLCCDPEGKLEAATATWSSQWSADDACQVAGIVCVTGIPTGVPGQDGTARADVLLDTVSSCHTGIDMVAGITLSEQEQTRTDRPSVILRRAGKESLWELAKNCASTIEAIRDANHLTDDPCEGQMLLIPVQ